jgi:hypothetical protein
MPNPFPGMNPYIEASGRWPGFHNAMITYGSELLNAVLPPNYAALIEERVELVEAPPDRPRARQPDLGIVMQADVPASTRGSSATVLADIEPERFLLPDYEETTEAYIEVVALPEQQLITSIEILSPSNKDSAGHGEYWAKRAKMLRQKVHLVEIDLLLQGRRLHVNKPLPPADFYALISRGNNRPHCEVYPWSIRRPLPKLPIPLRPPDPDIQLDLGAAFSMAYERLRYAQTLSFDKQLPHELKAEDREWAESLVKCPR